MEVEFLGQPFAGDRRLGHVLAGLLEEADSLIAITAWAQSSGMRQVEDEIRALRSRGGSASAVLGIDGGIATRESLELAVELFDPVFVFHDTGNRLFHPKVYCVEGPEGVTIAIGSSNLTGAGLFANYEANVVLRLAPDDPHDQQVHESVRAFRDSLADSGGPCQPLTLELIGRLAEEETLITSAKRRAEVEAAVRGKAEGLAREVFGAPVTGLPGLPKAPVSAVDGDPAETKVVPASTAPAELRWWKKLTASDVLRKPEGSHQRNYVALTKAGHPGIDQKTWFRDDLFGTVDWVEQTMQQSERIKEVATVEFDVLIEDEELGQFAIRIDHAEGRIANQNNAPTYLNWSSMIRVIRENDFRDWWLDLARLSDGKFRLRLLREEPVAG
ncbi:MAG: hypothetical protein QOE56_1559 [Solirubrobacterales bacterium]|nr:hypothetical protein [Solirubrobacterales bacterium]